MGKDKDYQAKHRRGIGLIPMGDRKRETPQNNQEQDRGGPDATSRKPYKPNKS